MSQLEWKKIGEAYHLITVGETLIRLQIESAGASAFWLQDERFEVKRSGFWNQRYTIYKNKQVVVSVSHQFWGSKGKIEFTDGTLFSSDYNYKNTLTLQFFDGETEIVSYSVGSEQGKRKAIIKPGIAMVDADRLLILTALGMVMFLNIFNEFKEDDDVAFAMDSALL